MVAEFIKFLCVGLVNSCICLSFIMTLRELAGWHDIAANAAGYVLGGWLGFQANKRWSFGNRPALPQSAWLRYACLLLGAWLLNMAVVEMLLHGHFSSLHAHALGIPVYTLSTFLGCRLFIFRKAAAECGQSAP